MSYSIVDFLNHNELAKYLVGIFGTALFSIICGLITNWIQSKLENPKGWVLNVFFGFLGAIIAIILYYNFLHSGNSVENLSGMSDSLIASSSIDESGQMQSGLVERVRENKVDESGNTAEEDNLGNTYKEVYGGRSENTVNYNVYNLKSKYEKFCCIVYVNSDYRSYDAAMKTESDANLINDSGVKDLKIRLYDMSDTKKKNDDGSKDYSDGGKEISDINENTCPLMEHGTAPQLLVYNVKGVDKLKIVIPGSRVVRIASPMFFKDFDAEYEPDCVKSDWLQDENGILYLSNQNYFDSWNNDSKTGTIQQRDEGQTSSRFVFASGDKAFDQVDDPEYILCTDGYLHNPGTLLTGANSGCQNYQCYWIAERADDGTDTFTEGGLTYRTAYKQIKGTILLDNKEKNSTEWNKSQCCVVIATVNASGTRNEKTYSIDSSTFVSGDEGDINILVPDNTKYIEVRIDGNNVLYISDLRLIKENAVNPEEIRDESISYEEAINIDYTTDENNIDATNAVLSAEARNPYERTITDIGMKLYDNSGVLVKEYTEGNKAKETNPTPITYNIQNELKVTLTPNTTYQYEFFVKIDGIDNEITGARKDFTTAKSEIADTGEETSETEESAISGTATSEESSIGDSNSGYKKTDYEVIVDSNDGKGVNLRSGPGRQYAKKIEKPIPNGTTLTISLTTDSLDGDDYGWGQTEYMGETGWIYLRGVTPK